MTAPPAAAPAPTPPTTLGAMDPLALVTVVSVVAAFEPVLLATVTPFPIDSGGSLTPPGGPADFIGTFGHSAVKWPVRKPAPKPIPSPIRNSFQCQESENQISLNRSRS